MGFYDDRILPRLIDVTCGASLIDPLRKRATAGLHGDVVEIGFGSGLNVPFYPAAVAKISAVEPADIGWRLAGKRVAESAVPIERSGLDGQSLPFDDDTFDSALSTFTLCTIPDVMAALSEVRRVLKPGGTLHFVEHGIAPDPSVQRWQRRLEPIQKRVAGGCHLTRDTAQLVTDAGFELIEVDAFYQHGTPRPYGAATVGVGRTGS